jgi:HAD superfamily hydrolase (TIGR01490 family)
MIAFFDFDETVVAMKSMFDFLAFAHARGAVGEEFTAYQDLEAAVTAPARRGEPRETVNRAYYRCFAGKSEAAMDALATAWADEHFRAGVPLLTWTAGEIGRLRAAGTEVAFVSGSFRALIAPLAERLGAGAILCSVPAVTDGVWTGELEGEPMIGAGKERAVRALLVARGLAPEDAAAYGDHLSDAPMLAVAGRATAVNPGPELAAVARERGWRIVTSSVSRLS